MCVSFPDMQKLDDSHEGNAPRLMVRVPVALKTRLFKLIPKAKRGEFIREAIREKLANGKKRSG